MAMVILPPCGGLYGSLAEQLAQRMVSLNEKEFLVGASRVGVLPAQKRSTKRMLMDRNTMMAWLVVWNIFFS
jgi:hypothetical protein